ncbi:hypothetical protein QTP88_007758 [Uroleucon formosanum]
MDTNVNDNYEENLKRGQALLNRIEEIQYSYFNGRPEWISLQKDDLKLYLAHLYYGHPSPSNEIIDKSYEGENSSEELFKLYKNEIKKKILKTCELLKEKCNNFSNIKVGITMTHSICKKKCDICQNFPKKDIHCYLLLRLKLINNKLIFFDFQMSRTYTSWDDYIENNNLPEGFMFYPKSGFYDPSKTLYQNITPASKTIEKVLKAVDVASNISFFVACSIRVYGLIFPIAAPIALGISLIRNTIITVTSTYQAGRQVQHLMDMFSHNISNGIECYSKCINLAICAIGAIAAPIEGIAAMKEVNSTTKSTGKAFAIFQKSACITQCTLEVVRVTLDFMNDNFKITLENVLKLRLDLFLVTGCLMRPSLIKDLLKFIGMKCVWTPIYKTIEQIPYCLGQYVWNSVYFFKRYFAVFAERVIMFLVGNLTSGNLLFAWKNMYRVFDGYQKQTTNLDIGDLLRHVVDCIDIDESVKYVLRGQNVVNLLNSLRDFAPKKRIDRALIKYCVDHILRQAKELSAERDDCLVEIARYGETRVDKVDEEFCKVYGLEKCSMDQYALWAVGQVNAAKLMAEYEKYASRPENTFDDEMVVKCNGTGWSSKGYSFVAPCGVLDLEMCLRFAEKINPQPHMYLDHKLVQPEPGVSLLLGISAYSVNIVFFGIDLINGVPKMNICFFDKNNDSGSSVTNHGGLRKLQKA